MYTDLHCHLLWGIDDGPEDPAATLSMARALSALGFGAVAPSTHAQPQFPGRADVATRREEVRALLAEQGIALSLFEGAENMLDEQFLERELSDRGWHINGGPWLLVEVPFEAIVPTLAELVFRLRRRGSRPLFAHPDLAPGWNTLIRGGLVSGVRPAACWPDRPAIDRFQIEPWNGRIAAYRPTAQHGATLLCAPYRDCLSHRRGPSKERYR